MGTSSYAPCTDRKHMLMLAVTGARITWINIASFWPPKHLLQHLQDLIWCFRHWQLSSCQISNSTLLKLYFILFLSPLILFSRFLLIFHYKCRQLISVALIASLYTQLTTNFPRFGFLCDHKRNRLKPDAGLFNVYFSSCFDSVEMSDELN